MTQRKTNLRSLLDIEVFHQSQQDFIRSEAGSIQRERLDNERETTPNNFQASAHLAGWYWWSRYPSCLSDLHPYGPYDTEEQALEAAYEVYLERFDKSVFVNKV
jgi:hypothetical protein